jgi:hypothetical protein
MQAVPKRELVTALSVRPRVSCVRTVTVTIKFATIKRAFQKIIGVRAQIPSEKNRKELRKRQSYG